MADYLSGLGDGDCGRRMLGEQFGIKSPVLYFGSNADDWTRVNCDYEFTASCELGSGLQERLIQFLSSPSSVAEVKIGDEPTPIGNGTACSQLILSNAIRSPDFQFFVHCRSLAT
ncbi:MAG: hypothetical protein ABIQ35_06505, partial [Verrucomicrobiota bacterium]